jgi:hypothetical protein
MPRGGRYSLTMNNLAAAVLLLGTPLDSIADIAPEQSEPWNQKPRHLWQGFIGRHGTGMCGRPQFAGESKSFGNDLLIPHIQGPIDHVRFHKIFGADLDSSLQLAPRPQRPVRIAVIGNHLPRRCGIATFTTDLCNAIAAEYGAAQLSVVAVNDPGRWRRHGNHLHYGSWPCCGV